jgi:hypothetical protein
MSMGQQVSFDQVSLRREIFMAHAAWQQRAIMAAASAFGPEDWPDINATQGNKEVECYGHGRGSGQKRPNSEEWSKMHDILEGPRARALYLG